jgi:hypothetical protein
MSSRPKCILITGPAHSGTRLLVQMLDKHPDVSAPMRYLTHVGEFRQLYFFFVRVMDATPLYSEEYVIDYDELRFIMDAYMQNIDHSKPFCVLKMPFYPLICLDWFINYFDGNLSLVYNSRPAEKIVRSFINKKQDQFYFHEHNDEILRHIKKLPVERRKHYLATSDAPAFFHEYVLYGDQLRQQWNKEHPERQFIDVPIENVATSRDNIESFLQKLSLPISRVDDMLSLVDPARLLRSAPTQTKRSHIVPRSQPRTQAISNARRLKRFVHMLTPPILWQAGKKLIKRDVGES